MESQLRQRGLRTTESKDQIYGSQIQDSAWPGTLFLLQEQLDL